jgi:alpha-L-rhamnosidase
MIPPGAGKVTVRDIAVSEYHYPFTGEAAFTSSDPELNRLYQAGIRTTKMNSFDAFTDCPTREQRAWVGDGVVHQMVHLVANEDWRLARNYVTLGASPRPDGMLPMTVAGEIEYRGGYTIPDWALHWIHGVWNQFRHDGDRSATLRLPFHAPTPTAPVIFSTASSEPRRDHNWRVSWAAASKASACGSPQAPRECR